MIAGRPYNPLDKATLVESIELELLAKPPVQFSAVSDIKGAGVYVVYYTGEFPPYQSR